MADWLVVDHLTLEYGPRQSPFRALEDITLALPDASASLCLVGRSGAGKSSFGQAVLGLLPSDARTEGAVNLPGGVSFRDEKQNLREYRRTSVGAIFQDAAGSLVPGIPVGRQMERVFRYRRRLPRSEAAAQARAALIEVGLDDHERIWQAYPSNLSGGMCQRVMIALALAAAGPLRLIVADEPLSALDCVSAAQILDLILRIRDQRAATLIYITHDLRVAGQFQFVGVISKGRLVELEGSQKFMQGPESEEGKRLLAASRALEQPHQNRPITYESKL